jgi:hypothetical protein
MNEMTNFVMKMRDGYAYASLKTLENVVVSQLDCDKAVFMGFVIDPTAGSKPFCRFCVNGENRYQLAQYCDLTPIRAFTMADCDEIDGWDKLRLSADRSELLDSPTWFHKNGLQQTATGYGKALTNSSMVWFEGKFRRIYTTIFSNVGTSWFRYQGKQIVIG